MPGKGYKVLSVKEEVVTKIQDRAKKEEVSISKLLEKLLGKSSINTVKTSSNDTVIETIRATIREELKSSTDAVTKSSTAKECNCITKEDLKNDIASFIETEIQKGFKNARSGF